MTSETVFVRITAPLQTLLKKEAEQLQGDSLKYKLSLYFFTINLVYAILNKTTSISLLVTEIKTLPIAELQALRDKLLPKLLSGELQILKPDEAST
ncbi:hypothetical protein [Methylocucumis oryzae]|uniref:Uncharacterized protein n=1 Tax=Methylocucumis oryzae TaxID=1632867 RepID=A0A0F3IHX2_9GAMM|nr:hypothetical protein [Methylocucumis oryzae]KJV06272.1 hypothetical protein VZ94_12380 [Methylocucumis oryzae]